MRPERIISMVIRRLMRLGARKMAENSKGKGGNSTGQMQGINRKMRQNRRF